MSIVREGTPIAARLADAVNEKDLAEAWRGVKEGRARRARRRAQLRVAAAACVLGALALGAYAMLGEDGAPAPLPLARAGGEAFERVGPAERVVLADRSRVETDGAGAIDVLENAGDSITLHLTRGRGRFEVTPRTGRRWRVEAAGVSVEVVGTVFTVERGDEGVDVAVERGVVIVRGARVPDGVRRLQAGDALHVPPEAQPAIAEVEPARPEEPAPVVEDPAPEVTAPSPERPSARALLAAADRARAEGRREDAIEALSALVSAHPRSREAPLAAFTNARLLRESGRTREAASWYRRALTLGLPEPLAESAESALVELSSAPE